MSLLACIVGFADDAYAQDNVERAQSFYSQAISLYSKGRYEEAIKAFDRAIEADPQPLYYCNKSVAQVEHGELDDAVDSITTCRDTYKGPPEALAKIDARLKGLRLVTTNVAVNARVSAQQIDARKRRIVVAPPKPVPPLMTPGGRRTMASCPWA